MNNTIFVSIASYRDNELIPTLKDMVAKADHPEQLFISICWQVEEQDFSVFMEMGARQTDYKSDNPDVIRLEYLGATLNIHFVQIYQAKGACWARYCCEQYYTNEQYFLQIDSHCRFIKNWDTELIAYYLSLKEKTDKPIISGYPPGYTPATEDKEEILHAGCARMVFNVFNDNDIPSFLPLALLDATQHSRGCFLAGGFTFSSGMFVLDVPNDPLVFFIGEEISMSAKAFTHGYDIFYPEKQFLWHFYGREGCDKIWGDHTQEKKEAKNIEKTWVERDVISKKRVRQVLGISQPDEIDLGKYTLGTERTLEEYEYLTGICFNEQLLSQELLCSIKPSYFDTKPASREEWIRTLYSPYYRLVEIQKNEIPENDDNIDYWSLGVFTEDDSLLAMQRITPAQFSEFMPDNKPDIYSLPIKLKEKPLKIPKTIRLAPFFGDTGWGETLEKAW
ncbi:MAG TPA: glycosyltransferase [Morganella sp. (in: Bacteria)]|nr:glycosyltransferase [Morganella sp. (in: enterobacteria)]